MALEVPGIREKSMTRQPLAARALIRTHEDPRHECMCIVTVGISNIREAQDVQLLLACSTGGIYREQDWPCEEAADQADDNGYLQISEQEVSVKRAVLQHISIWNGMEGLPLVISIDARMLLAFPADDSPATIP